MFREFQQNRLLGSLLAPLGSTLGTILVAFALLGVHLAPLGLAKRSKSYPKVENRAKKLCPGSAWAPRGAKRTPNAPQALQNGPQKFEKKHQNMRTHMHPTVNFAREARAHRSPSRVNFTTKHQCFQYVSSNKCCLVHEALSIQIDTST